MKKILILTLMVISGLFVSGQVKFMNSLTYHITNGDTVIERIYPTYDYFNGSNPYRLIAYDSSGFSGIIKVNTISPYSGTTTTFPQILTVNGNTNLGNAVGDTTTIRDYFLVGSKTSLNNIRFSPDSNKLVMGAYENYSLSKNTTIFGGSTGSVNINKILAGSYLSTIAGGYDNTIDANAFASTISGGAHHRVNDGGTHATIGGGSTNTIEGTGDYSFIGAGISNTCSGTYSTVLAGNSNTASGVKSIVLGGTSNTASGEYSTILGGNSNTATAKYTLSWGRRSQGNAAGTITLSDSIDAAFANSVVNSFAARFAGGYYLTSGSLKLENKMCIQDSLYRRVEASVVANDANMALDNATVGFMFVFAIHASTKVVTAWAWYYNDAAGNVTLILNSTGNVTTTANTPASLNIYKSGALVRLQNKLAANHIFQVVGFNTY